MTTQTASRPASTKQLAFIRTLLAERPNYAYTASLEDLIARELLTSTRASKAIDSLLATPKTVAPATPVVTTFVLGTVPAEEPVAAVEVIADAAPRASLPTKGIFTVVLPSGERRTLRFAEGNGGFEGRTIVSFLSGSDNTSDYTGFADVSGSAVRIWRRYAAAEELAAALDVLTYTEEQVRAGEAYAIESGHCYRCNRLLTVPSSIHRGLGPDCAKLVG